MIALFDLFYQSEGICTDTRNIRINALFVALKGDNFDGNDYVLHALDAGAKFAISQRAELADNKRIFYVDNCLVFLQKLANFHRKKFDIPVIGITGSNGKTTTKELVQAVLSVRFNCLCTKGNLNNHLGVPFTLLELNEQHQIAVIEMGANKLGDIQELVAIAEPTHGIITGIGAAHIEGFGSLDGVINTKSELYDFLKINSGTVFINDDDPVLKKQLGNYFNRFTYGLGDNNQVQGKITEMNPFLYFSWHRKSNLVQKVHSKMVGSYNLINFLCAAAVGVHFGIPDEQISISLCSYTPSNNRSQITKTASNTVIMDAYNANVTSMNAALQSFMEINHRHKCVILGDMRELGALSDAAHQQVVDFLRGKDWGVYLVGSEFAKTIRSSKFKHFDSTKSLMDFLVDHSIKDALVLIKGSRGIALEQVLAHL